MNLVQRETNVFLNQDIVKTGEQQVHGGSPLKSAGWWHRVSRFPFHVGSLTADKLNSNRGPEVNSKEVNENRLMGANAVDVENGHKWADSIVQNWLESIDASLESQVVDNSISDGITDESYSLEQYTMDDSVSSYQHKIMAALKSVHENFEAVANVGPIESEGTALKDVRATWPRILRL
eukprot:TRINITY_DN9323_c0_g1_i6.p1 TRINITY_DN9323_c0_g1~~TRINITY_DN9323_c0_g1_i6.p1  ORF type:complete len:179 (-),score=24.09 TRINITY_DN9323_c0_g1_i6:79-615(-)